MRKGPVPCAGTIFPLEESFFGSMLHPEPLLLRGVQAQVWVFCAQVCGPPE